MARMLLMADKAEARGRVKGKLRLDWMDGVMVSLGSRGIRL